jgi:hypothetical protein
MEKTYTVAGTATQYGITKVRFANDFVGRMKILIKNGCDPINLVELPEAMTKVDALKYLKSTGEFTGDDAYAIDAKLGEKMREAKRGEFRKEISLEEIRSRKVDDVTATDILEQTGFIDVDLSELEVD